MPHLHQYRIFISHAWKYNKEYYRLTKFLDNATNFRFANYSVPKHSPVDANNKSKLKEQLRRQIRPVEVVIVLGGMYVSYSDWIQFEIDYASNLQKPILGIAPWGSTRIPKAVQGSADKIVGWNTSTIVSAIRRLSQSGKRRFR